jgi:hypothetical protein
MAHAAPEDSSGLGHSDALSLLEAAAFNRKSVMAGVNIGVRDDSPLAAFAVSEIPARVLQTDYLEACLTSGGRLG